MARIEAENALKRLTAHPQDFGFNLKPDDRRVIEAQRTLGNASGGRGARAWAGRCRKA
jgi:hypothetical protein